MVSKEEKHYFRVTLSPYRSICSMLPSNASQLHCPLHSSSPEESMSGTQPTLICFYLTKLARDALCIATQEEDLRSQDKSTSRSCPRLPASSLLPSTQSAPNLPSSGMRPRSLEISTDSPNPLQPGWKHQGWYWVTPSAPSCPPSDHCFLGFLHHGPCITPRSHSTRAYSGQSHLCMVCSTQSATEAEAWCPGASLP